VGCNLGHYDMKLNLGFEAYPYTTKSSRTRKVLGKGARIHKGYGAGKNTAEVAQELEEKYKLVETFWEAIEDTVVEKLEDVYADMIEDVLMMQEPSKKAFGDEYTQMIQENFRTFLDKEEHGIKTAAAARGVSHLLPQPYSKNNPKPRPSFIDTGLYRSAFRAWVEED